MRQNFFSDGRLKKKEKHSQPLWQWFIIRLEWSHGLICGERGMQGDLGSIPSQGPMSYFPRWPWDFLKYFKMLILTKIGNIPNVDPRPHVILSRVTTTYCLKYLIELLVLISYSHTLHNIHEQHHAAASRMYWWQHQRDPSIAFATTAHIKFAMVTTMAAA